jgi:hypothetical protein
MAQVRRDRLEAYPTLRHGVWRSGEQTQHARRFKSTLGNIAYWRLINTNGGFIARILGGAVGQTALSEEEGFTVDTKGPFGTGQFEDHEGAAFHKHSGTGETPMLLFARLQAPRGAARSRAYCIIGVSPVFPICANGDDQKLESQTLRRNRSRIRRPNSTNTAAQARRLCYFSLGFRHPGDAARSRAHCIIGVPPVFRICANGDNQKLESQTLRRSQSQMREFAPFHERLKPSRNVPEG